MISFKAHNSDATALAHRIQKGDISPIEAVEECFKRLPDLQKKTNALTYLDKEGAKNYIHHHLPKKAPFRGVPILLKGLGHAFKGYPSTAGSRLLKDAHYPQTDFFTQSLLDAGFVPIGQTNVPEFGLKYISDSALFGPVKNPMNPAYYAGGSSGGSAAAVKSGMVGIASASDGGGSIRIPASFCGLVGLKPTRGRTATGPTSFRGWEGAAIHFVLAKSVRDTASALLALQRQQDASPFQVPLLQEKDFDQAFDALHTLTIAYSTESPLGEKVSDEAILAVEKTAEALSKLGFNVKRATPKIDGKTLLKGYYLMNAAEMQAEFQSMEEAFQSPIQMGEVEPISYGLAQHGKEIKAFEYPKIFNQWDQAAYAMSLFHKDFDLFLQPTTMSPAPALSDTLYQEKDLEDLTKWSQTGNREQLFATLYSLFSTGHLTASWPFIYNLTGQPALTLPLHNCANGLPLGVMFSAPKGREDLLLALAAFLENNDLF